jgi:predicted transposase YbfD/YdcC
MGDMGYQKKIAEQIVQQGADYVLSLKGNHGLLHGDIETYFTSALSPDITVETITGDHGRIETRSVRVTDDYLLKIIGII